MDTILLITHAAKVSSAWEEDDRAVVQPLTIPWSMSAATAMYLMRQLIAVGAKDTTKTRMCVVLVWLYLAVSAALALVSTQPRTLVVRAKYL